MALVHSYKMSHRGIVVTTVDRVALPPVCQLWSSSQGQLDQDWAFGTKVNVLVGSSEIPMAGGERNRQVDLLSY